MKGPGHLLNCRQRGNAVRIVIVDDHPIFRDGLKRVLEDCGHSVLAECGDARSGLDAVRQHAPDLVVMDLQMPGGGALAALRELKGQPPAAVLTVSEDVSDMEAAAAAGATAYLLKSTDATDLVPIIETVANGYRVFPDAGVLKGGSPRLSARQRSVLDGLVGGLTLKEIAQNLGISQFTVRTYQERLLEKFEVSTRAELIAASLGHRPDAEETGT